LKWVLKLPGELANVYWQSVDLLLQVASNNYKRDPSWLLRIRYVALFSSFYPEVAFYLKPEANELRMRTLFCFVFVTGSVFSIVKLF